MQLINSESTTHKTRDEKFGGYLVIKDFLSPDVCENLERELVGFFSRHGYLESYQPRQRVVIGSAEWSTFLDQSPAWAEFSGHLHTQDFIQWWINEMKGLFEHLYPSLKTSKLSRVGRKNLLHNRVTKKLRFFRPVEEVFLEGDISLAGPGYEVGPHHDNERKRFVGLLYFGSSPQSDDDDGGHLLLLANRDSSRPYQKLRRQKEKVDDRFEEKARVFPVKNTLCSFVNSKNSIHAVTPYQPAVRRSRMFFYFSLCVADKNLQ